MSLEEWWAEQEPVPEEDIKRDDWRAFFEDGGVRAAWRFYRIVHSGGPMPPRPLSEISFMAGVTWERERAHVATIVGRLATSADEKRQSAAASPNDSADSGAAPDVHSKDTT